MAYGDGHLPEELEHTEILFRCEDLLKEWFLAFRALSMEAGGGGMAPGCVNEGTAERLAVEWAEQRLEETALELSLHLKARRLKREKGVRRLGGREEGAA